MKRVKSILLFFYLYLHVVDKIFNIRKLTRDEAKTISDTLLEPHVHGFEELIIGLEGDLEHFIDFKSETLTAPYISFVTKGKLHRVKPLINENPFTIIVLEFNSDFIPETTFQLYSYYHDHANIHLGGGRGFDRIVGVCEMMEDEARQNTPDYSVIRPLLNALFFMIESERKKSGNLRKQLYSTQNITFSNFLALLEENFRRPPGVEFYAEKLFMSVRNLNLVCQNIMQKSVSEIIETRKLIEAKNLLISTSKTISEIGYELGYNEKSYFTAVFKKKSGMTPSGFRDEMKSLIS
jgi:AraC-like DNA-binding protein